MRKVTLRRRPAPAAKAPDPLDQILSRAIGQAEGNVRTWLLALRRGERAEGKGTRSKD
jgi:hypothetical protein